MEESHLDHIVLALLFASDEPLSPKKLAGIIEGVDAGDVRGSVQRLTERVRAEFPSVMLENVAGGWQLATNPDFADYVALLYSGRRKQRLSKAGLETLAIIAYKQPVTRADIENIRGVSCGGVITTLMERTLIRIVGKAKVLGAPFLYGTTQEFLEYLGINSLKDLPSMEELEELLAKEESNVAAGSEAEVSDGAATAIAAQSDQPAPEDIAPEPDFEAPSPDPVSDQPAVNPEDEASSAEPSVYRAAGESRPPAAVVTPADPEEHKPDMADRDEESDDEWKTHQTSQDEPQVHDSSDPVQTDK